jgi:class 3 adenylate cyclase
VTERDLQRLTEAGVYAPASDDAAEQRAVLERLLDQGITVDELAEGSRVGDIVLRAFAHLIQPGPRTTLDETAAAVDMPPDLVLRIRRAWGFPDPAPGERAFTQGDVEALLFMRSMGGLVGSDLMLHTARAIATAMSRVAEAEISLVRSRLEAPMRSRNESGATVLKSYAAILDTFLPAALRAMDAVHRAQLAYVGRRYSTWALPPSELNVLDLVIGFADLTGSTAMVRRLDLAGLDRAITRFEEVTSDLIAAAGATLVKRLGDGVMFVTPRADAACGVALDLVDAFRDRPDAPPARVGLAVGHVAALRGDFYGPAVHLAARLAQVAAPATVAVSAELRERMEGIAQGCAFRAAGRRELAGFEGAVEVWELERAAR